MMLSSTCLCSCIDWIIQHFFTIQWGALGTVAALGTLAYQIRKDRVIEIRKQASAIACWIVDEIADGGQALVYVSNMTNLPIYEVVLSRDIVEENKSIFGKGHDSCSFIQTIPPGIYKTEVPSYGNGMSKKFDASISFRDVNGKYWYRDAAGHLNRIKNSIDQRELDRPIGSATIQRVDNY